MSKKNLGIVLFGFGMYAAIAAVVVPVLIADCTRAWILNKLLIADQGGKGDEA
jgi:hypothetical protein